MLNKKNKTKQNNNEPLRNYSFVDLFQLTLSVESKAKEISTVCIKEKLVHNPSSITFQLACSFIYFKLF